VKVENGVWDTVQMCFLATKNFFDTKTTAWDDDEMMMKLTRLFVFRYDFDVPLAKSISHGKFKKSFGTEGTEEMAADDDDEM
jgi:hypothetical protein